MITIQRMEKVNLPLTMEEAESENNNYKNTHNIPSTKLLLIIIAAVCGIHDISPAFSLSVKVDRIIRISEHFSLNVAYFFFSSFSSSSCSLYFWLNFTIHHSCCSDNILSKVLLNLYLIQHSLPTMLLNASNSNCCKFYSHLMAAVANFRIISMFNILRPIIQNAQCILEKYVEFL